MQTNEPKPQAGVQGIKIIGSRFDNNGGAGIHVEGPADVEIVDSSATGNAGGGLVATEAGPERSVPWFQRPIGILVLAVVGGVILAAIVAGLKHLFPDVRF